MPAHPALRLASLPGRPAFWERIMSEAILDERAAAWRPRALFTFFCGGEPTELADYDGQLEVVGRCLEWFVFDYTIEELGATPAQLWLARYAEELDQEALADARDCLRFILGLFEVGQVETGRGFYIHDLLRRAQVYHVREPILSREARRGQLIVGRIFPYRDHFALSGMATVLYPSATGHLKQLIAEGEIQPEQLVGNLDGVELENLLGARLEQLEQTDAAVLEQRLRRYLEAVCPGRMSFAQMERLMHKTGNSLKFAQQVCGALQIRCRHEMDLLFHLLTTAWAQAHRS